MHQCTNHTHREPLILGFHCMHWQSPTSPGNCPEYELEYFPMRQSLMGRKLFSTQLSTICAYWVLLQHLVRQHFSSLTPLVNQVTRRENPQSSLTLPQGLGSLALHCTKCSKGRVERGCSNLTELQDTSENSGLHGVNAPFFPFFTLPILQDIAPCIKCSKMQSYSFTVEALRVTNLPEHDAKHRALLGCTNTRLPCAPGCAHLYSSAQPAAGPAAHAGWYRW